MKTIFDAIIKDDGNFSLDGELKIDKEFFEKNIKNKQCEKVKINGEDYWVFKKGDYYIIDKLKCLDEKIEKFEKEAIYDGLTGCYNKREIVEFLKKLLHNYLRYKKEPFSVLMLDIDFFKKINDTYGHLAGDMALKEMAHIILNLIRKSDLCGRFGGEEFLIILPNTKIAGALKLANRIKDTIENHSFKFKNQDIKFTVSIGITAVGLNDDYNSLISRVDEALYEAKNKGRNRIEYR
jgi:diguanylate cyclase (GGDEF)-like protein